jgi:hypothetical protein
MSYSRLPCEVCKEMSLCRFTYLEDDGLQLYFCKLAHLDHYMRWQASERRAAQLEQNRIEQNRIEHENRKVRPIEVSQG